MVADALDSFLSPAVQSIHSAMPQMRAAEQVLPPFARHFVVSTNALKRLVILQQQQRHSPQKAQKGEADAETAMAAPLSEARHHWNLACAQVLLPCQLWSNWYVGGN